MRNFQKKSLKEKPKNKGDSPGMRAGRCRAELLRIKSYCLQGGENRTRRYPSVNGNNKEERGGNGAKYRLFVSSFFDGKEKH